MYNLQVRFLPSFLVFNNMIQFHFLTYLECLNSLVMHVSTLFDEPLRNVKPFLSGTRQHPFYSDGEVKARKYTVLSDNCQRVYTFIW